MERRLKLARKLLNPNDSVLIVTIDEKEYLRLGLLLEQTFPEARIQMVSIETNPKGTARGAQFARSDEYAYFVMLGSAGPSPQQLSPEWFGGKTTTTTKLRWVSLIRSGTNAARSDRPGLFYPVFLDSGDGSFVGIGESLQRDQDRTEVEGPANSVAIWPIRQDGSEGNWQVGPAGARKLQADGHLRVGGFKDGSAAISYLKAGERAKVDKGLFGPVIRGEKGHIEVAGEATGITRIPTTQWSLQAHSASEHGSRLLRNLLPGRLFPFPKSLYAVEDALRFFVATKPDALIVDFFAGSGTTAHAVMRLNRQDNSRRRTISVTNNEVGISEQSALTKAGHRPGDPPWEALGICDYITKPRITAAITGTTPDGSPVRGDYRFTDPFPMADGLEENVDFFTLTYEDPRVVGADMAFEAIAPLLWMRGGARGRQITTPSENFALADTYGVLFAIDAAGAFAAAVDQAGELEVAFVVTDDEKQFQRVAALLPGRVETVRLYESYLRTFEINTGKE